MRFKAAVAVMFIGVFAALVFSYRLPLGTNFAKPVVGPAISWSATTGETGAVEVPAANCGTERIVPVIRNRVVASTSGEVVADLKYEGSPDDAQRLRRADPDTYEVRTTVRCGQRTGETTQVVSITTKTPATTISPDEFAQIQNGMSREQVTAIVGYGGRVIGKRDDAPNQIRQFEEEPFLAYANVEFRDGVVIGKKYDAQNG